jgi:hypothetical protein
MTSNPRWQELAPGNKHNQTLGEEGLETFGFFLERYWIWAGIGYLLGFTLLVNFLAHLALKYYSGQQQRASVWEITCQQWHGLQRNSWCSCATPALPSCAMPILSIE